MFSREKILKGKYLKEIILSIRLIHNRFFNSLSFQKQQGIMKRSKDYIMINVNVDVYVKSTV